MGRVQQLDREGKPLPPAAAVDKDGNPTTDPHKRVCFFPFGAHKGYGLSLINEIVGGVHRRLAADDPQPLGQGPAGEKGTCVFFFQVIHPDAINGGASPRAATSSRT